MCFSFWKCVSTVEWDIPSNFFFTLLSFDCRCAVYGCAYKCYNHKYGWLKIELLWSVSLLLSVLKILRFNILFRCSVNRSFELRKYFSENWTVLDDINDANGHKWRKSHNKTLRSFEYIWSCTMKMWSAHAFELVLWVIIAFKFDIYNTIDDNVKCKRLFNVIRKRNFKTSA